MKHVKQVAHELKDSCKTPSKTTTLPPVTTQKTTCSEYLTAEELQWLFRSLAAMYGHALKLDETTVVKVWGLALSSRGLTKEDFRRGLSKCIDRGKAFPPTLPEFVALCQLTAEDLGLPSV